MSGYPFTPGPWKVDRDPHHPVGNILDGNGKRIATCSYGVDEAEEIQASLMDGRWSVTMEANALAIALVPDMVECLEKFCWMCRCWDRYVSRCVRFGGCDCPAQAILRKLRGQVEGFKAADLGPRETEKVGG